MMAPYPALRASAFLVAFATGPAFAHAFLSSATPAVGSTVADAPHQLTLNFTEALEPAFSSVEVRGADGAKLTMQAKIAGQHMLVSIPQQLAAGTYHVIWRATAKDTHKTQGDFTFTVGR